MEDTTFDVYKKGKRAEVVFSSEEEKFFGYVNSEVDKMKKYLEIKADGLTFDDLNRALANYASIHFSLQTVHFFAESKVTRLEKKLSDWRDEKENEIRAKHNKDDIAGTKWLGQNEIASLARKNNKEEYDELFNQVTLAREELRFMDKMIKSWESHSYCLTNLCNNLKTEVSITVRNLQ